MLVEIQGSQTPRIHTPPLRELTPETSYGFAVIEFANKVLQEPLLPWQEYCLIHAGELLENGKPRFKKVLILVARQNGKTHLVKVLSLYWLFIEQVPLVAGTSATLKMAKEAWGKSMRSAQDSTILSPLIRDMVTGNNDPHFSVAGGSRYIPAAANESSLRGYTVDRLIVDELRLHKHYKAWDAGVYTTRAVPDSQVICITNAGYDDSIVLNELRDSAIQFVESDGLIGDQTLGIFEWSAPDNADPLDPKTWAQANPSLGMKNPLTGEFLLDPAEMQGDAIRVTNTGGTALSGFLTEALCIHVKVHDSAVDKDKWDTCYVPGSLDGLASQTTWGFDVDRNNTHATLIAAAESNGATRLQVIRSWDGQAEMKNIVNDLVRMLNVHKPRKLLWFPIGPAGTYATTLKEKKLVRGVVIEEITSGVSEAHMGFANAVQTGKILHTNDPLLTAHVTKSQKLWTGDRWKFTRTGSGSSDAAYAAAAAWLGAQTLPAPLGAIRLIGPDEEEEEQ